MVLFLLVLHACGSMHRLFVFDLQTHVFGVEALKMSFLLLFIVKSNNNSRCAQKYARQMFKQLDKSKDMQ